MPVPIRAARADDGPELRRIELLAGERFRDVGLASVADHEPASLELLADYAARGRGWVAIDEHDRPIGYVIVDVVDSDAHIEQISVTPDRQGMGVARALIDRVREWACTSGASAITLTTLPQFRGTDPFTSTSASWPCQRMKSAPSCSRYETWSPLTVSIPLCACACVSHWTREGATSNTRRVTQ